MELLKSTKSKINKDKNGENVPHLEITEVMLIHFNIIKNDYQQDSRVLHKLVPNISPQNFVFLKTFHYPNFHIFFLYFSYMVY